MRSPKNTPDIWPLPKYRRDGFVRIVVVLVFLLGTIGLVQYLVTGVGSTSPPSVVPRITAAP
ncbi:MAG: hypothetical protein ABI599_02145 [Flavobacteriales bacterium]